MRTVTVTTLLSAFALAADHVPTGPAVGATIPALEANDLNGQKQTLASLTGPKGLMLVFFRSADW